MSVVAIPFLVSLLAFANTIDPSRPEVDATFDGETEARIQSLRDISVEEAFAELKDLDFLINDALLHKAIFVAFESRRTEAIALSIQNIRLPIFRMTDGRIVSRADDFRVAKKILHVFPDEALESLLTLYENTDPVTKGNIVRVLGQMAGGQIVKDVLVGALDDKVFCEEEYDETVGEPLRICDVAYGQLVLQLLARHLH